MRKPLQAALLLTLAGSAWADPFRAGLEEFLEIHCHDCHADGSDKGGLDFDELGADLSDPATFARWEHIFDRVVAGEMPPKKKPRPEAEELAAFRKTLAPALTRAHAAVRGTVLRRLNRREYENTLNDLFGTNLRLAEMLPEDGRSHEFDNVGEALNISLVQLQQYLRAADAVLDSAIASTTGKPESKTIRASYADTRGAENFLGKNWLVLPDGAVMIPQAWGYPTGMLREANTRTAGYYKVRVTGYAWQSDRPITFSIGATTFQRGAERPTFSYHQFPPGKPTTIEIEAWIERNYMIEVTPYGIYDRDYSIKKNGLANYKGPGLAISHVEIEGPLTPEFPSRGHRLVFDGIDRREIEPRNPAEKKKSWYKPKFEVVSDDRAGDARRALERVAIAAFRRPATAEDFAPYLALFEAELAGEASFEEALRTAVSALFCSPRFLFLHEAPGRLDDHALASRLAYFLTRTSPDDELLRLAKAGKLGSDPAVLRAQADRLLAHPHFARFLEDFTDAWLNLRDIDFTVPDRKLFPEFDQFLQFSMLEETRAFLRELIESNQPVTGIVRSDFAMLNSRLADHYGVEGVKGPHIRRVPLPDDSRRGGFLTQGSVLKVSANGTNTSPVVRGAWVLERILNEPPKPPPPGIPGVEPDIRGATTLRELLDKHRDSTTCRSCHQKIDPPGFALESFNPIGGYRARFRSLGEGERVDAMVGARRVQYRLGPPVDASGEFPDGTAFADINGFRAHLASDPDRLARAFATKLLTFATGREMGFSDRPALKQLVAASARKGHRIRDLLYLVISSEIFRTK